IATDQRTAVANIQGCDWLSWATRLSYTYNKRAIKGIGSSQGRTDNSWGPGQEGFMGPLCPCPNSKKRMKWYQGHLMGPPTDPRPSSSVSFPMVNPPLVP
ncbi:unnamed protein product, partial [Staurois parvus]